MTKPNTLFTIQNSERIPRLFHLPAIFVFISLSFFRFCHPSWILFPFFLLLATPPPPPPSSFLALLTLCISHMTSYCPLAFPTLLFFSSPFYLSTVPSLLLFTSNFSSICTQKHPYCSYKFTFQHQPFRDRIIEPQKPYKCRKTFLF